MAESFEDAMAFVQAMTYDGDMPLLNRLQKAYEHDMAELRRDCHLAIEQARDPQRIGGTLERDSFAYAIEQLREFRWQHATNDDDAIPYINGVAKAHEHELEQIRRSRFHKGYVAGQRSMDAEHYQLKLRLQGLKFGDGSHENLSRLAYAIYPCPTGWGKESCEGLRDKLIELLGGVHDGSSAPSPTACGACDDACARDNGDETEMSDNGTSPNADRTCPNAVQGASITDEPDSQESPNLEDSDSGDEPNFTEIAETIKLGGECDGKIMENGENHQIEASNTVESSKYRENYKSGYITDELRERIAGVCKVSGLSGEKLYGIADRIDEQFNHAMTSRSAELGCYKLRINQLEQERDELRKSLRKIAEHAGMPHDNDLDEYSDDLVAKVTIGEIDSKNEYIGALEWQRDRQKKLLDEYERRDTAESIVRDIHLGKVTDSQAVERIRALP